MVLTNTRPGAIIIKSPRARATKTAHSGNEIKKSTTAYKPVLINEH